MQRSITSSHSMSTIASQHRGLGRNVNASDLSQKHQNWQCSCRMEQRWLGQPHHSHQGAGTSLLLHSSPSLPNTSLFTTHSHGSQHYIGKGSSARAWRGEELYNRSGGKNTKKQPTNQKTPIYFPSFEKFK